MLQRPDEEARFLRQNIITPDKLGKYNLRRYVPKTIQLNVGSLYQPLKFNFDDYAGDFQVYFSHKIQQPSREINDQMATRQAVVMFPIS